MHPSIDYCFSGLEDVFVQYWCFCTPLEIHAPINELPSIFVKHGFYQASMKYLCAPLKKKTMMSFVSSILHFRPTPTQPPVFVEERL